MPTNKSPDMDRLTVQLYRVFWDVLSPDLVIIWANTYYKVIAKAISLRLGSMLADVVHPNQTYTVPGWTLFDNLYLVQDLLELGCRDGLSFAFLSLDQEKAFDRVDHKYLLGTLWVFGFGPQFVGFLQVLYANAECLVRLNWTLTELASFGQGVWQGCPLSGQLYALAIEPFLRLLRQRLVLREPELQLVLSAYADDVLLVVQDPDDLVQVEACQAVYSATSSAPVNWVKSSGLVVRDRWQASSLPPVLQAIRWSAGPLLYLSVYLSAKHPSPQENWQDLEARQASVFLGTLDPHECLVLDGDFNTTLEERDRSGTEQCPAATDVIREIVEHQSLVDVWRNHHLDDISTFTFVQWRPIATVTASVCTERPWPAYWHFNNSLLEDVGFMVSFQEFWLAWRGQQHAFPLAQRWWDLGKVRARLFCCDYTRGASRRRDVAIEQLELEVLELERHLAASPEDPPRCGACREKREELRALEDHRTQGTFV
ncbi:unnamed protein product [Caretta caretta]